MFDANCGQPAPDHPQLKMIIISLEICVFLFSLHLKASQPSSAF